MKRFIQWTTKKMESHPIVWRVAILILCFLLTGYLEAQDEAFFRQLNSMPTEAERIALSLHRLYCSTIAPRQTYAAVEATCERLDIADLGIALTGTVDRVRRTEGGIDAVLDALEAA